MRTKIPVFFLNIFKLKKLLLGFYIQLKFIQLLLLYAKATWLGVAMLLTLSIIMLREGKFPVFHVKDVN